MSFTIRIYPDNAGMNGVMTWGTLNRDDIIICLIRMNVFDSDASFNRGLWRESINAALDGICDYNYAVTMPLSLPTVSWPNVKAFVSETEEDGDYPIRGPDVQECTGKYNSIAQHYLDAVVIYPRDGKIGTLPGSPFTRRSLYCVTNRTLTSHDYIIKDGGFYLFDLSNGGALMLDNTKLRLMNKSRFEVLDLVLQTYRH